MQKGDTKPKSKRCILLPQGLSAGNLLDANTRCQPAPQGKLYRTGDEAHGKGSNQEPSSDLPFFYHKGYRLPQDKDQ